MDAGEKGSTPHLVMLETWLQESGCPPKKLLKSSAYLSLIITLPFSTLTTPWWYIGQVHPPAMLETWLLESRVRLLA